MSFLNEISEYIKNGEAETENLGLEIEHFIIDKNGLQIQFAEISSLIDQVGEDIGAEIIYMDGYPVGYYTGEYSVTTHFSGLFREYMKMIEKRYIC